MYDLIVVGSGPGGYEAALEASKLSQKVLVIEKGAIGGCCLNVGCIPSKTYLKHAEWFTEVNQGKKFGVNFNLTDFDFSQLVKRKDQVVKQLQQGITYLFKQEQVDFLQGEAKIIDAKTIQVGQENYQTKNILLATGSKPVIPRIKGLEEVDYLTTETIFSLTTLPESLAIIGGGVIGIELAFAFAPLGVKVTVIELAADILMTEDPDAGKIVKEQAKQLGISFYTGAKIKHVEANKVYLTQGEVSFDHLLIATGRKANLTLAQELGLALTSDQQFIAVNQAYQTSLPNIYAIGDVIGGSMLAHSATAEGIYAVRQLVGQAQAQLNSQTIPRCVYTKPEIASFGLSYQEAIQAGYEAIAASQPFSINGKALASLETAGFVKIISEKENHEILGAVIVGKNSTELIQHIIAVVTAEGSLAELAQQVFAHPTLAETIGDVARRLIEKYS